MSMIKKQLYFAIVNLTFVFNTKNIMLNIFK